MKTLIKFTKACNSDFKEDKQVNSIRNGATEQSILITPRSDLLSTELAGEYKVPIHAVYLQLKLLFVVFVSRTLVGK